MSASTVHEHLVTLADGRPSVVEVNEYVGDGLVGDASVVVVATQVHRRSVGGVTPLGRPGSRRSALATYICRNAAATLDRFVRAGRLHTTAFEERAGRVLQAAGRRGRGSCYLVRW